MRSFGFLTGGVDTDRLALDDGAGVDGDVASGRELEREVVHAARSGATLLLADAVVLRAVAAALEPLARGALGHAATEVRALLVRGDEALLQTGHQAGLVHALGGTERLFPDTR